MASAEVLEFDPLLQEISEDQPAGPSLRGDAELSMLFYEVRDKRRAASDAVRQIAAYDLLDQEEREYETRPEPPHWEGLVECATNILTQHSKDLWVSAWLVEALTHAHGFAGLRDGARLIRELCERFWDDLHPRPDGDEGLNLTLSQVAALNDLLLEAIDDIPLTAPTGTYPGLTSADYKDAASLETRLEEKTKRQAEGGVTIEAFDRAASEGHADYYQQLVEDIDAAERELAQMEQVIEAKCDEEEEFDGEPPSVSRVNAELAECRHRVHSFAKHLLAAEPEQDEEGGEVEAADGARPGTRKATATGEIQSREDAFRALTKIAEFFRRTEPHSPASYALEQVVRWGGMSLPELMRELIKDQSVRGELFRRTGIEEESE